MLKDSRSISTAIVFLCIFQLSQAATYSGQDTLSMYSGLRLGHGSVKIEFRRSDACRDSLDIFYTDFEMCCLAIGCNCGMRMGSSSAIYLSKVPFDSIDFEHDLALQDTTLFSKGGTSHAFKFCPMAPSFFAGSDIGAINWQPYENGIMVIRTFDSLYALVRINLIYDGGIVWGITPQRIQIDWMVQDNGKAYFPNTVNIKNQKLSWHTSSFRENRVVRFDLQGRLLKDAAHRKCPAVMIEVRNGTVCRFVLPEIR